MKTSGFEDAARALNGVLGLCDATRQDVANALKTRLADITRPDLDPLLDEIAALRETVTRLTDRVADLEKQIAFADKSTDAKSKKAPSSTKRK